MSLVLEMGKRSYGSGSLRKRGDKWSIGYRLPNGKQRWETTNTSDKEIAEVLLAERLLDIKKGKEDILSDTKFKAVAEDWLANKRIEGIRPKTDEMFEQIIRCHLIPYFGDQYLYEIKVATVTDYRNKKLAGDKTVPVAGKASNQPLSAQTVVHHMGCLRQIFRYAMANDLTDKNVAELVANPSIQRQAIEPIDKDDIKALIDAAPYQYKTLLLLMVSTGLRISEATALRRKDWDATNKRLSVRGAVKRVKGKLVWDNYPKTAAGVRTLQISDALADKIDEQIRRIKKTPDPDRLDLLFPNRKGRPINPSNFRNRVFKKAAKEAGLSDKRLHDLRHTFASEQLSAGVQPHILLKNGGWSNPGSLAVYSHLTTADKSKTADSADLYS